MRRAILIWGLVLAASACSFSGANAPLPSGSGSIGPVSSTVPSHQSLGAALRECHVTPPSASQRPGAIPPAPYLGNGRLWAGLWPKGLVVVPPDDVRPDGFLRMKFMWVRGPGVHGILHISGDEVGTGASIRARSFGYGYTGFNASSIFFPSQGCYRITGRAGGAELRFVTLVRTCRVLAELRHSLWKKYSSNWCTG